MFILVGLQGKMVFFRGCNTLLIQNPSHFLLRSCEVWFTFNFVSTMVAKEVEVLGMIALVNKVTISSLEPFAYGVSPLFVREAFLPSQT